MSHSTGKSEAPELKALKREEIVNGILRAGAYGTAFAAGIIAPNLVQLFDKSLKKLDASLDGAARKREIMKTVYYMKSHGYLAGEYEHGLQLTRKARRRLKRLEKQDLRIQSIAIWDKKWRVIIYDIPEVHKAARQALTTALRHAGCFQFQKSAWITPFACRDIVARLAAEKEIDRYITYLETNYLDNDGPLIERFQEYYPNTVFH